MGVVDPQNEKERVGLARLHAVVAAAIARLAPTERDAVVAVYFHGRTQAQVAVQLQLTTALVATMIFGALRQIAAAVEADDPHRPQT
jgi:DNA-directed RNA polymerase specialized sigma24 family protein